MWEIGHVNLVVMGEEVDIRDRRGVFTPTSLRRDVRRQQNPGIHRCIAINVGVAPASNRIEFVWRG